jgi:hypothetical protein
VDRLQRFVDDCRAGYRQATGLQATCLQKINHCKGQMTPCPMLKVTGTTRFLETLQGGLHPSWSQMLAIKNALVFLECFFNFYLIRSFLKFSGQYLNFQIFIKVLFDHFYLHFKALSVLPKPYFLCLLYTLK